MTAGGTNNKQNDWQKMMAQMAMAQKTSPRTMLGFAAGKLLRQLFDGWKERYDARGEVNDWLNTRTPEEIESEIAKISQTNPQRAEYMQKHLAKRRGQNGGDIQPQINSEATNYAAQQFANQNLPQAPQLLGDNVANAADQQYDFAAPSLEELLNKLGGR